MYCSARSNNSSARLGGSCARVAGKNTTPEDLSHIGAHTMYLLQRAVARSSIKSLGRKIGQRVKARVKLLKRKSNNA